MSVRRCFPARAGGDDGQLMLLVLVYALIAGLLVTVVVDVSKVYLHRRSLVAAADGAALSAANQPDLAGVYAGQGGALPISDVGAEAAVQQYVSDAALAGRFDGFEVVGVRGQGDRVTVTLRAVVRMPFINLVTSSQAGGYGVEATATARSPFR